MPRGRKCHYSTLTFNEELANKISQTAQTTQTDENGPTNKSVESNSVEGNNNNGERYVKHPHYSSIYHTKYLDGAAREAIRRRKKRKVSINMTYTNLLKESVPYSMFTNRELEGFKDILSPVGSIFNPDPTEFPGDRGLMVPVANLFMINNKNISVPERIYGEITYYSIFRKEHVNLLDSDKDPDTNYVGTLPTFSGRHFSEITKSLFYFTEELTEDVVSSDITHDSVEIQTPCGNSIIPISKVTFLKIISAAKFTHINPYKVNDPVYDNYLCDDEDYVKEHGDRRIFDFTDTVMGVRVIADNMLHNFFSSFNLSPSVAKSIPYSLPKLRESIAVDLVSLTGLLDMDTLQLVVAAHVVAIITANSYPIFEIERMWQLQPKIYQGVVLYEKDELAEKIEKSKKNSKGSDNGEDVPEEVY